MDCTAINRLKLKEAFEDQSDFQNVTCDPDYLVTLFEWNQRGTIYIHDDASVGHSIFINNTHGLGADKIFKILNPYHKDLFLWHIDGVLYKKNSKCDCAFITDSHIGFVEFKSNASNNSETAIINNYNKAKSQLKHTIDDIAVRCNNVGIDLMTSTTVEAYAVFNRSVPRLNAYQKKLAASFFMETDGIPLYFRNYTEI